MVDVTGDIEGTVLAEGNLPPCGVKTTEVGKLGVLEGRGAGRGNVLRERDDSLLSRLEADRDLSLVDVQGHTGEAIGLPAEDDGVLVGVVGELGLPLAVVADPDATVVALVVLADGLDTEGVANVLDTVEKVGDEIADVVDEVANEVARLRLGRSSSGAGRGSRGRSGSRDLDLLGLERSSGAGRGGLRGLLLGNRGRGGGLRGGSRSGRSEDRAPVNLLPVDVLQVVGNATPVDVLGSRALSVTRSYQCRLGSRLVSIHLRLLTTGVEAGMAVVVVGSGGLADGEGAQHQGGRVVHFEVACWMCLFERSLRRSTAMMCAADG